MYQRIVVPLDGSERAEHALPHAKLLARKFGSEIVLVRVVLHRVTGTTTAAEEARSYLDRVIDSVREEGLAASAKRPLGRVPSLRIAAEADAAEGSLVCMGSHGFSGLRRWFLGNVANEVIKATRAPVLLVRPEGIHGKEADVKAVIAPLDGTGPAEQAIPHIEAMAKAFEAPVHLTYVAGAPRRTPAKEDMPTYLETTARHMRERTGAEVRVHVLRGEPAEAIVNQAKATGEHMIVMTTHSRLGFQEMLLGAMADRLAHRAEGPVLFVHPNSGG